VITLLIDEPFTMAIVQDPSCTRPLIPMEAPANGPPRRRRTTLIALSRHMDHVDYVLVVNRNWRPATRGLSFGAKGLLVTLLEAAAFTGRQEIAVSIGEIAPHLDNARGRESFAAWLAELRLKRLVRERGPGVFAIAPNLWSLEPRAASTAPRRLVPPHGPVRSLS
jgi:hypothetical protein